MTRYIGSTLPLHWQHDIRDSGKFRSIADWAVKLSCPLMTAGRLREFIDFVELSRPVEERSDTKTKRRWKREQIRYGEHDMQHIDLYWPNSQGMNGKDETLTQTSIRGTIFFVHGGAWGSGQPWMYRLCAPFFLEQGFLVAIVGYRTFPCVTTVVHNLDSAGGGVGDSQLCDIKSAWVSLQGVMGQVLSANKDTEGWIGNVLIGHSSGAHVALLMLVDMIGERLKLDNVASGKIHPDFFVGLSGPYDICDHYDYEAGRGVEQLSPMKAICGGTRDNFSVASPVSRMLKLASSHHATVQECAPPILLVHGIEDSTVPFTATSDAARSLRSCGLVHCDEVYLEKCEHADVVMQLMLGGGPTRNVVMEYLLGSGGNGVVMNSRL
jgi:acetyl esterase/lipase